MNPTTWLYPRNGKKRRKKKKMQSTGVVLGRVYDILEQVEGEEKKKKEGGGERERKGRKKSKKEKKKGTEWQASQSL